MDDEHLNEELDAVIEVNNQEGAPVDATGEEPEAETPGVVEPDESDIGAPEPAQPEPLGRGHRARKQT